MNNTIVVFCLVFSIAVFGCASTHGHPGGLQDGKDTAVKEMEPAESKMIPYYLEPYKYIWEPQILEEVVVPGAIRGGVYYPAHKETVIVKPAEPVLRSSPQ